MLKYLSSLGKSSAALGMSVGNLWHGMVSYKSHVSLSDLCHGMASCKSHVSELKNWMPMHLKTKKSQVSG